MNSAYSQDTPIPLPPRVASKIDFSGDWWLWTAYVQPNGYGKFRCDGRSTYAHRVMWELVVGPIPGGLTIDHICRVRRCVNPGHLRVVTLQVNINASPLTMAARNARKTHCVRGHPFDERNTYIRATGWRTCRSCDRERHRD